MTATQPGIFRYRQIGDQGCHGVGLPQKSLTAEPPVDAERDEVGRFKPGHKTLNPGGRPRKLRELEAAMLEAHGMGAVEVLGMFRALAMDPDENGKVRVAAGDRFLHWLGVNPHTKADQEDVTKLQMDQLVARLLQQPEVRERVRAQLRVIDGGIE